MTEITEHDTLFVGGRGAKPAGAETIEVISPHTEQVIGRVPAAAPADVDAAVAAARAAFDDGPWPRLALKERLDVLSRLSEALKARADDIARLISRQNGSPILVVAARAGMGADHGPRLLPGDGAGVPVRGGRRPGMLGPVLVRGEPVGVVAAIMPWNVPLFVTMSSSPRRCGRLHRRAQAGARDAAGRLPARRGARRGRPARGRAQRRAGRPRGRRVPRQPPRRRQGRLHRQHRGRPQDRRRSAASAHARHASSSAASPPRSCSTTPTSATAVAGLCCPARA